jgi:HEAT repeat protein
MADPFGFIETLIEQLKDPSRCDRALLALIGEGKEAAPALASFLRSSKPSSLPQARLLAVEGLSIVRGREALDGLIAVAKEPLQEISDPAVRLAEETVVSRAASALAEFKDVRARAALFDLLEGKPLVGVAEGFEKLIDPRAIPFLIPWLEEDFVAEAAMRAIVVCGSVAIPALLDSLRVTHTRYGSETGMSQRRRARILQILCELALPGNVGSLDDLLNDPTAAVRLNAVRLLLLKGSVGQQRKAFRAGLTLLQSENDKTLRSDCEELLISYFGVGPELVEQAIERHRFVGESEETWPRETTLAILSRIYRKGKEAER